MVSSLTDSMKNAAQGDMSFALKQFFEEGGAAYAAPVAAFTGPLPDDFIQVIGGARDLANAIAEALALIPPTLQGTAIVDELVAKIKGSSSAAEVRTHAGRMETVTELAKRLKEEEQDPEVQSRERIDRMWARIEQMDKDIQKSFKEDIAPHISEEDEKKYNSAIEERAVLEKKLRDAKTPEEREEIAAKLEGVNKRVAQVTEEVATKAEQNGAPPSKVQRFRDESGKRDEAAIEVRREMSDVAPVRNDHVKGAPANEANSQVAQQAPTRYGLRATPVQETPQAPTQDVASLDQYTPLKVPDVRDKSGVSVGTIG